MKGIALEAVVVMIIAIVSLGLMLTFFAGPFSQMLTDTYCFFNDHVFKPMGVNMGSDVCSSPTNCQGERVIIESNDKKYVKSQLAARALLCWTEKKLPSCGDASVCYQIILKKPLVESLTEEEFTQYLETEGACNVIENSLVYDATGTEKQSNCGDEDLVLWNAKNSVISDQSIVLVTYDIRNNHIVVDAGGTVTAQASVCNDAQVNNVCNTLDAVWGGGYRGACCRQFGICCA